MVVLLRGDIGVGPAENGRRGKARAFLLPSLGSVGSLQRPKKVTIHGSDGHLYPFLCKPKDDLRKDARIMELMTAVNRMLHKSSCCRRRRLAVRCYSVVPLDQECGLIEWVPNMLQACRERTV